MQISSSSSGKTILTFSNARELMLLGVVCTNVAFRITVNSRSGRFLLDFLGRLLVQVRWETMIYFQRYNFQCYFKKSIAEHFTFFLNLTYFSRFDKNISIFPFQQTIGLVVLIGGNRCIVSALS